MPDSVKCLRDIKSDDERFSEVPKRGKPGMSKVGKMIPCRSCLTEAMLVIKKRLLDSRYLIKWELSNVSKP